MGLRDSDADTHPNVVGTRPRFDSTATNAASERRPDRDRDRAERPLPRGTSNIGIPFRHDVSIFVPHALQFRVDGGEWLPLVAVDGRFDEPMEKWKLTTGPLAAGRTRSRCRARRARLPASPRSFRPVPDPRASSHGECSPCLADAPPLHPLVQTLQSHDIPPALA